MAICIEITAIKRTRCYVFFYLKYIKGAHNRTVAFLEHHADITVLGSSGYLVVRNQYASLVKFV